MSFLSDAALWIALAVTSGTVLLLHRRLKRLGGDLAAYRLALAESTAALDKAGAAVGLLVGEGQALAFALAGRIEEARAVLAAPARPVSQPPTHRALKSAA